MTNLTRNHRASLSASRRFISSAFSRNARFSLQPRTEVGRPVRHDLASTVELDVNSLLREPVFDVPDAPEAPDPSYITSIPPYPPIHADSSPEGQQSPPNRRPPLQASPFARYRSKAMDDSDSDCEGPSSTQGDTGASPARHSSVPSRDRDDGGIPRTLASRDGFQTPERSNSRSHRDALPIRHSLATNFELQGWDAETISNTPSKGDNNKWLESLGFDLKGLDIDDLEKEEIENKDPNSSQIRRDSPKFSPRRRPMSTAFESPLRGNSRPSLIPVHPQSGRSSLMPMQSPSGRSKTPRRTLDLPVGSDLSRQPLIPGSANGKTMSARKTRRSSARVSSREMKAILEGQGRDSSHPITDRPRDSNVVHSGFPKTGNYPCPTRETGEAKTSRGQGGQENVAGGSEVVLTPVRASKVQRDTLGSDTVVTPVRRSLRNSYRKAALRDLHKEIDAQRGALESADYAYVPNETLRGTIASNPKVPRRPAF